MRGPMPRLLFLLVLLVPGLTRAQLPLGEITGRVTDHPAGRALAGVRVTVSGPALLRPQETTTLRSGQYLLSQLPPGDGYTVRFARGDLAAEVSGLSVQAGQTLELSPRLPATGPGQRTRSGRAHGTLGVTIDHE